MRLTGKTAIVTGGASGFGEGIVRKFVAAGARVMIADINSEAAASLANELGEMAQSYAVNVASYDDVQTMAEQAFTKFGKLDILVNNAGVTHHPMPMEDVTEDEFDRVLAVNAKSVYLSAKHIVPHMKANGSGAILNVASTAGISPRPNLNWYNASKGWMITATKTMAIELAAYGVRVNAINPVAGETPLLQTFMGEDTPEIRAKFLATIPLGRFSTPEDMGNAACFLCSDEASMITGIAMEVDGGRCI
ncbi:MAG: SDR family oxidoreductase [Paracoccaceae bacterium]